MAKEKKKNIIILQKKKHTIVINGKRSDIYTLPAAGLAMIAKEVTINFGEAFKERRELRKECFAPVVYTFAGLASSFLTQTMPDDVGTFVTSCSLGLAAAGIIGLIRFWVKLSKTSKEIARYKEILRVMAKEMGMRQMYTTEDMRLALKILAELEELFNKQNEEFGIQNN